MKPIRNFSRLFLALLACGTLLAPAQAPTTRSPAHWEASMTAREQRAAEVRDEVKTIDARYQALLQETSALNTARAGLAAARR